MLLFSKNALAVLLEIFRNDLTEQTNNAIMRAIIHENFIKTFQVGLMSKLPYVIGKVYRFTGPDLFWDSNRFVQIEETNLSLNWSQKVQFVSTRLPSNQNEIEKIDLNFESLRWLLFKSMDELISKVLISLNSLILEPARHKKVLLSSSESKFDLQR